MQIIILTLLLRMSHIINKMLKTAIIKTYNDN